MVFTDERIIETYLRNDGYYPGDPQMARVYSFTEAGFQGTYYAVFSEEKWDDLGPGESPTITWCSLLWDRSIGLTEEGKKWLRAKELEKKRKTDH